MQICFLGWSSKKHQNNNNRTRPLPSSGAQKKFKQNAISNTVHTITVSEANYNQILRWHPELKNRMSVIHNGIDLESFEKELIHFTAREKQKIRTQLFGATNGDDVILTIAALHPRKGLKYLLKSMPRIIEQKIIHDWRLLAKDLKKTTLKNIS